MLPVSFEKWMAKQNIKAVGYQAVSGGCVATAHRVDLSNKSSVFIKHYPQQQDASLIAEAEGLRYLAKTGKVKAPGVLYVTDNLLVLEYIETSVRSVGCDQTLGRQLAELHGLKSRSFGFPVNTFCGLTEQPNKLKNNGYEFYAEQRFLYLARLCMDKGLLDGHELRQIERICSKLEELIPEQEAALIHGDLWSGNAVSDQRGLPVLIDPAAYWGWPEADLAMTQLFGGFSEEFYHAYIEINALAPGWQARMEIYNLWHLLNHLMMFGMSYRQDVQRILERYA